MTEVELRKRVCAIMAGWLGGTRGSKEHAEILSIYNSQSPLPRGYRMQVNDDWCAATVSAAFLKAGIAPYTGTECSCGAFITLAKARGIWIEDDAHRPEIGDAIIYDWKDNGLGDDTTGHNHIGIVTEIAGTRFTVTEGNMSGGKIHRRTMSVDGRYIRGYICPDYAEIAKEMTAVEKSNSVVASLTPEDCYEIILKANEYAAKMATPEWMTDELKQAVDAGITDGMRPLALCMRGAAAIMALRGKKNV